MSHDDATQAALQAVTAALLTTDPSQPHAQHQALLAVLAALQEWAGAHAADLQATVDRLNAPN